MAGLVGKGSRSYKKARIGDSNLPAIGFRRFQFAFENVTQATDPTIAFAAVIGNVPAEMTGNGFFQPTLTELQNAKLGDFTENVVVMSNLNGVLSNYITYTITNDSITFLNGYVLEANEIITFSRGQEPVTGNRIVNARPLRQSGDVDFSGIGSAVVNFSVPEGFRIAPSVVTDGIDSRQIGFVQVFVDGVLQFRNNGNGDEDTIDAGMQTGNYRELFVGPDGTESSITGGIANTIRFNMGQPFDSVEGVLVISTNLIVDDPNNTSLGDQLDTTNATVAVNTAELARIPTPVGATATNILQVNAGQTAYELVEQSGGGGALVQIDTFLDETTTNDRTGLTYTLPSTATAIKVTAAGAGASGGSGGSGNNVGFGRGGVGGAAGQIIEEWINLSIRPAGADRIIITVPTGATGTATTNTGNAYTQRLSPNSPAINCQGLWANAGNNNLGTAFTATSAGGFGGGEGNWRINQFPNIATTGSGSIANIPSVLDIWGDPGSGMPLEGGSVTSSTPLLREGNSQAGGGGEHSSKAFGGQGGDGSNNGAEEAAGGGGGGGAGWFNGNTGNTPAAGAPGGVGGRGGNGGCVIEAYAITINEN